MATRKPASTKTPKTTSPVKKAAKTSKVTKETKKTKVTKSVAKPEINTPENAPVTRLPKFKIRRAYLIGAVILLALAGLIYSYRSLFVVATVNGQPINRLEYIKELENLSGQQAMNSLVTKTLILQEARENNVTVSDEDNLKAQGQDLNSVLTLQGLTPESLREQIYLQKLIEKMVGQDIKVTDEEIDTYLETNQESLPESTDSAQMRSTISEQLKQQKLNDKVQTWLQELQQNAKINYLVTQ